MAIAQRARISKALKTAAFAGVLGIIGSVLVPAAQASLLTVQLQPTSASNGGVITGQNVALTGPGTINFNIVAILHNADGSTLNDGVNQVGMSVLTDSGGALGTVTLANVAPFNGGSALAGTPSGTPVGVDVGPDRPGTTNTQTGNIFYAQTAGGSAQLGGAGTGDLSQIIGTGSFNVTASSGSTTIQPVLHNDSRVSGFARNTIKFTLDGHDYILNADGTGSVDGTTPSNPLTSTPDVSGGTINVTVAPEPGSLALAGIGGVGLLLRRRRR